MALNSMWAMACRKAALPSTLPRPRCGTSRGITSRGRSGRPGTPIGSGAGASSGITRSPARKAAASSCVRRTFSAGSRIARHSWAASNSEGFIFLDADLRGWTRTRLAGLDRWSAEVHRGMPGTAPSAAQNSPRPPLALCLVGAELAEAVEVAVGNAGDVFAAEAAAVELAARELGPGHRRLEVGQILVNQPVAAQQLLDLGLAAVVRHQLLGRGHVDAVDVRMPHRRRRRGQVDLARAGIAGHLHDLLAGGATDDGIVHQQHHPVTELQRDRIELAPHRTLPLALAGHDEGAADVAVLDEALAVLHPEQVGDLQGGVARGVGDRDHRVDVVVRAQAQDLLAEGDAHAHARLVHG